jgi:two-component system response regulator VicR
MEKRILIIEDDLNILEILNFIFKDEGFEVISNNEGMPLNEIESFQPDIILLDVRIGGYEKTGAQICIELKEFAETRDVPVILLSAEAGLAKIAKKCGADAFISKPFEIHHLVNKVEELIHSRTT